MIGLGSENQRSMVLTSSRFVLCLLLVEAAALALLGNALPGNSPDTAPHGSTITIHVSKSGLFSGFAHNHVVVAPIAKSVLDPQHMTAEIVVHTREMKVIDPGDSDSTRLEIQTTMLGPKVLNADKYPGIRFKSARIEQLAPQHYRVTGNLELHGVSKEISFDVSGSPGNYRGSTKLKQTDFGIEPVSIGGGTVKVKDVLDVEFDVYGEPPATGNHH
jgi:hypothetical protein